MAKMAKPRQRAAESIWMPKVAPWRVAILAIMVILGKMTKNRQRAGDSIWMPKEARWRVVILPKMANLDGENDEFDPNGKKWPGLVESGDFGENDKKSPEGW